MATITEGNDAAGRDTEAPAHVSTREKSQLIRQKFQQVVIQAMQRKGEGDGAAEDKGIRDLVIPKDIDVTLNLSKMNVNEFPADLLDRMESVQYLYLDGSNLTRLPDEFFQKLPLLKWLDLRNNSLTCLPVAGLRNHPSLEVILLQGNRIRQLPIELATLPRLKGIQTSGNPLTNVPYDSVAQGFSGIMNHLKKLCSQNDILYQPSEVIDVTPSTSQENTTNSMIINKMDPSEPEMRMWDLEKLSQWRAFMKKKSKNTNSESYVQSEEKPKQKISVTVRSYPKPPFKPVPFRCGIYNRNRRKTAITASHYHKMRRTRLGYKRKPVTMAMVEEKARKEAYFTVMRETLEKQARKIQRMRDKDVLKSWRDHARFTRNQMKLLDNYQQYPSRDFANKTPFDVDPEFLNMLNRVDLYRSLRDYDNRSKRVKKPKIRITAFDLERQMNEIISKLQKLDTSDGEEIVSPRLKQTCMSNKMNKILDIQKTLKHLQSLNSSMAGITPLSRTKN